MHNSAGLIFASAINGIIPVAENRVLIDGRPSAFLHADFIRGLLFGAVFDHPLVEFKDELLSANTAPQNFAPADFNT